MAGYEQALLFISDLLKFLDFIAATHRADIDLDLAFQWVRRRNAVTYLIYPIVSVALAAPMGERACHDWPPSGLLVKR